MNKYIAEYSDIGETRRILFSSKFSLLELEQGLKYYIDKRITIALFINGLPDTILNDYEKCNLQIYTLEDWFYENKVEVNCEC